MNEYICDQCGKAHDEDTSYTCESCGMTVCDDCMVYHDRRHLCGACAESTDKDAAPDSKGKQ